MRHRGNLSAVITAGALACLISGCGKHDAPQVAAALPTVRVQVVIAENKPRSSTEEVVGTVRSRLHAVIAAKISGRVEQMLATPGQSAKRDDLLAQLDSADIRARVDQAVATRDQLGRDAERLGRLFTNNTISAQEFESAQSRLRAATAAAEEAQSMLGYMRILAPFDGVVTRKLADVGDLATPSRPLLEMEDPRSLRFEADVPEGLVGNVKAGATLPVRISPGSNSLDGIVSEIAPVADPSSRTFQVKLDLPGAAGLRSGQFGRVILPVGEHTAVRVPASAVIQRGQMEMVFIAEGQRAQMRLVKTGKRVGDEIELVSGLNAGERVIIRNATNLVDGQPIEVGP